MGSTSPPDPILFDYQYAPNAQRARNLLNLTGIPYEICEQPFVQPRPILRDLGITYRRIPVNTIGKDVYVDNRVFLDAVFAIYGHVQGVKDLVRTKHDQAYEAFGYRMFWNLIEILPDTVFNEEMIQDRKDLYSMMSKPDYREVRPAAIAAFKQFLDMIENDFLSDDEAAPWIAGSKPGVADLQAVWIPKFALETIKYSEGTGESAGMGKAQYPRVHRWLSGFSDHVPDNEPAKISGKEASKKILELPYAAADIGIDEKDPTGFKAGDKVQIATTDDTTPGNTPQLGTLVGLSKTEMVIQLDNTLRIHFPRIGYSIKRA